jgi:hypothetical protein
MQLAHKLNSGNQGERLVRAITALYQLLPPPRELFLPTGPTPATLTSTMPLPGRGRESARTG